MPLKAALAERKSIDFVTELTDGRVIAIANRPMPDGRWVSTHDDITVQQNSEKALRDQKMQLDAALNNMSQGLCMFDGDARLILCNHRYLQMSGLSVSDLQPDITLVELLEKRRAKGTWSSDPKKYTEELRATLAKGETFTITVEGPDGRTISIYNRPLPDGQWVSCHEDITERCKAEQQTHEQKRRLDAAIQNMSQGLCMFDPDGRIVLSNPRYAEMMNVSPDFLANCTLAALMAHRKAAGEFSGDPAEFAASVRQKMREGKVEIKNVERSDGRVHQVVVQPMREGGWVTTLEDVTERRLAQERLREQKLRLDAAPDNMSQGLCMFDAQGRIVLFNSKYAEIVAPPESLHGLSFAELLKRRKAKGDFAGDPEPFAAAVLASVREGKTTTKITQVRSGRIHRIVVQPMPAGGWVSTLEDIPRITTRSPACPTGPPSTNASAPPSRARRRTDLFRADVARHRSLQGDQRRVRPRRRRRAAVRNLAAPAETVGGAFLARLGGDEFTIISTDGEQPAPRKRWRSRSSRPSPTRSTSTATICAAQSASASRSSRPMATMRRRCSPTPTPRSTAPRPTAAAPSASSKPTWTSGCASGARCSTICAPPIERGRARRCTISRRPRIDRRDHRLRGAGCAGIIRSAAWSRPTRSSRSPRKAASSSRWANGSCARPAARRRHGRSRCRSRSTCRRSSSATATWPRCVHAVLLETGLAPARLELEITEGVLIGDFARAVSILRRLKALGVRIAMDDFGTGYSSLSYLQSFPFDKIKIDRTFISNLETQPAVGDDRARGDRPRARPQSAGGGRRRGDQGAARVPVARSLRRGAGLSDRPAAADRGLCGHDRPRPNSLSARKRTRRARTECLGLRSRAALSAPRSRCQAPLPAATLFPREECIAMSSYKFVTYQSDKGPARRRRGRRQAVRRRRADAQGRLCQRARHPQRLAIGEGHAEESRRRGRQEQAQEQAARRAPSCSRRCCGRRRSIAPAPTTRTTWRRWRSCRACRRRPIRTTVGLKPWHFIKASRTVTGDKATVKLPKASKAIDWEAELGAVIGKGQGRAARQGARLRRRLYGRQRAVGARPRPSATSFPTRRRSNGTGSARNASTTPARSDPGIVPASDIKDPQKLGIKLWVNDVIKQDSNTSDMIFTLAEQIEHLSSRITL